MEVRTCPAMPAPVGVACPWPRIPCRVAEPDRRGDVEVSGMLNSILMLSSEKTVVSPDPTPEFQGPAACPVGPCRRRAGGTAIVGRSVL